MNYLFQPSFPLAPSVLQEAHVKQTGEESAVISAKWEFPKPWTVHMSITYRRKQNKGRIWHPWASLSMPSAGSGLIVAWPNPEKCLWCFSRDCWDGCGCCCSPWGVWNFRESTGETCNRQNSKVSVRLVLLGGFVSLNHHQKLEIC